MTNKQIPFVSMKTSFNRTIPFLEKNGNLPSIEHHDFLRIVRTHWRTASSTTDILNSVSE